MRHRTITIGLTCCLVLQGSRSPAAQVRPETTSDPANKPAAKPEQIGVVRENSKDGLKYVWVPPGTFTMGCSKGDKECFGDEIPAHQVTITNGIWIGQTEVTVAAYKRFAAAQYLPMPTRFPISNIGWANDNMPIAGVTWLYARDYCTWSDGRLPTEAEWEYAARGGTTEARYGDLGNIAWYKSNSGYGTRTVALKRPNAFGLFDTLGNVWEWVSDWYDPSYFQNSPSQDPSGPSNGKYRLLRGGSWSDNPGGVRVSIRRKFEPDLSYEDIGFRCVVNLGNP